MFQDGRVVFVRHGGVFVRVSLNRLLKAKQHSGKGENADTEYEQREVDDEKEVEKEDKKESAIKEVIRGQDDDHTVSETSKVRKEKKNVTHPHKIHYKVDGSGKWMDATVTG